MPAWPVGVDLVGVAIGWLSLARVTGRITTGNARTGAMPATAEGMVCTALAVLHLATCNGGPSTGNGIVRGIAASLWG
ncbi:DUF6223 family protein [Streptomyces sp. NPDC086077]|uniref:DUF6223 family protein n=1 Tax=Streptomyces sp. NPDC086077 TaxID=3154862 RepID=UPI0034123CAA